MCCLLFVCFGMMFCVVSGVDLLRLVGFGGCGLFAVHGYSFSGFDYLLLAFRLIVYCCEFTFEFVLL